MIYKFETFITPFHLKRTIHLYLPKNYFRSEERYPVMYMYDGHNLFYDEDATYGKSWGLKDFLDSYDKPFIVVGIECNHEGTERLNEYCPYTLDSTFGHIDGKGKEFMDWVVYELKPYIDEHYRTIPFRECTGIGGSSMGGLMSLYTVIKYNQYFSKAACLSPSIAICHKQLKEEFKDMNPDTRVYLSYGKKEVRGKQQLESINNLLLDFQNIFSSYQATCLINITTGRHNEASWEKENLIYMNNLWK